MAGDGYRVGVLGATGLVGTTILELLADRKFPAAEVVPFASERSAGREIEWNGTQLDLPGAERGLDPGPRPGPLLGRRVGQRRVGAALRRGGSRGRRQHQPFPDGRGGAAGRRRGESRRRRGPQRDHRQPELLDDADGRRAQASPGRGRDRAAGDLDLPGRLRDREGGGRRAARAVAGGARRARPRQRASIRTGSPSTSCRRRAASPTATITPTRSAS